MTSTPANLSIVQGQTWTLVITYLDPNGAAINTSGFTANMDVRDRNGNLVVNFNTTPVAGGGSITMGGANGQITLKLTSANSASLLVGTHKFDLFVNPGSEDDPLLGGTFEVLRRYTQVLP